MSVNQGFDAGIREAEPMIVDDTPPDTAGEIVRPRLGADSLVWKFYGDSRGGILGFQRLAGTENCIEQLGQAVLDHSVIFSDFLGRAKRTGPPVMKTVYSTEPEKWGRTVREFHRDIKGTISDGSRYHALNPELFYWAHATFVDQVLYITDTFIRRLSYAEKVQIFEESKVWYQLYGVSDRGQPPRPTRSSSRIGRTCSTASSPPQDDRLCHRLHPSGGCLAPKKVPGPVWTVLSAPLNAFIRTVIVGGTLPQQMRDVCDLEWNDKKEKNFQRFAAFMRAINPLVNRLPLKYLYVPWAYEAWTKVGVDPRPLHNKPA